MLVGFSFLLVGAYNQIKCQIFAVISQRKSYFVFPLGCYLFKKKIVCNSCRPISRQHGQSSFLSFLLRQRLILVSYTIIFHQVLFLGLILLPECIGPSDFLKLIYYSVVLF